MERPELVKLVNKIVRSAQANGSASKWIVLNYVFYLTGVRYYLLITRSGNPKSWYPLPTSVYEKHDVSGS